ncbi:MAG: MFS transporter [Bacteroidales bacterium]|nr:MFS transporter [Bacteroidales bacterium]
MSKQEEDTQKPGRFQTGNVVSISLAHFLHDVYSAFLAPLLPMLIEKLGISYSLAGLLRVIQRIPSLFNPFIGLLADRFHARWFIILAPAVTAIGMSLIGLVSNYFVLVILLFITGISVALFHVPAPVMIKKVSGAKTGQGLSFYMVGGEIARSVGPMMVLGAVTVWGLEGTYKLIPFGLGASLLLYFRLKNIKISPEVRQYDRRHGMKQTFLRLLPFFLLIGGFVFFRASMKASLTVFLPTYMVDVKGETNWMGGIALSILELAGAAGTLFFGTASDRIGRKSSLYIVASTTPVIMWLFTQVDGWWSMPLLVLLGFSMFAQGPILLALVQDLNSKRPAYVNGIYMTINFALSSLMILLVGALGDWFGLQLTFEISAFIALASIPLLYFLFRRNYNER